MLRWLKMTLEVYHITPVPKPRMTQADRWRKRPCVVRYFAFCDECQKHPEMVPQPGDTVIFVTSAEAAVPFRPPNDLTATDATIVGVVDEVSRPSLR